MNNYPKRPADEYDNPNSDMSSSWNEGHKFRCGSAYAHAGYLIEMSRRHPIMYWLWYRWWIPSLLHEDERKKLVQRIESRLRVDYRPYWADFALYHPIQFLMYLLLRWHVKQMTKLYVKLLSTAIQVVRVMISKRIHKSINSKADVLGKDKFIQ